MLQSKWVASLFLDSWRVAQEGALGNKEKTESMLAEKYPDSDVLVPDAGFPNVSGRETLQDSLCLYDPVHNHVGYVHMDCVDYD